MLLQAKLCESLNIYLNLIRVDFNCYNISDQKRKCLKNCDMDTSATMIHSLMCTGIKYTSHFLHKISSSFGQDFHYLLLSKAVFFSQNIQNISRNFMKISRTILKS